MFALCLSTPGASRHPRQRGIRFAIPSRLREIHPPAGDTFCDPFAALPAGSLISPSGGGGPDEGGTGGGPAPKNSFSPHRQGETSFIHENRNQRTNLTC
jgi:hypothetical protein